MKIIIRLLLLLIIAGHYSVYSQVTLTSTASSQIVPLTSISEVRLLSFGQFTPIGDGGSITISPQGVRTSSGSIILKESAAGQAIFTISGINDNNISVIFPSNNVNIYHQNGVNAMYLNAWTVDISQKGISTEQTDVIIKIGCTLNVSSIETNPIGVYSGSYSLTFFYN